MNVELCLPFIALIPFTAAGLALIQQGLGRSRSAAHTMLGTLCAVSVSALVFVVFGSALSGFSGEPAHVLVAGGHHWDWAGSGPFFPHSTFTPNSSLAAAHSALLLCFGTFAAGLGAVIPIGTGTDRWRLAPTCVASALVAAFIFPLFAHWAWGAGWLSQMNIEFQIPNFVDVGGAGVIQVVGGLMALTVAWIVGPRQGKFEPSGMATAIPAHNIVLVLFGCVLALIGWIGLDCAASVLLYRAGIEQIVWSMINTVLSASAGCMAALIITRTRYRKPDASLTANGWIAGLVAGSAACGLISSGAAIATGLLAGVVATYLIEILELHLRIDDPAGSISVHAGAGIWGIISVGIFGHFADGTRGGHILAQIVGVASLLGFIMPVLYAVNVLLNRAMPYRVDNDGDWQGMDIRELGAGAYPEFVVHADDFVPR